MYNDRKHKSLRLSEDEIAIFNDFVEILEWFYDLTLKISFETNITLAVVIPILLFLKNSCTAEKVERTFSKFIKQCLLAQKNFYDEKSKFICNECLITASYFKKKQI